MRSSLAALALALALPLPSIAGAVQVQPGETLSEIADRLGVSVQQLIDINRLKDPDHLEAGIQLKLPPGVSNRPSSPKSPAPTSVTVGQGETLSAIADRHGVPVSTLMALNSLSDPNHVEVGQVLKLKGARYAPATSPTTYTPGASEHVVRKGESLSAIARGTGVPMGQLLALNTISDPNNVQAGTTLRLKGTPAPRPAAKPKPPIASQPKPAPKPAPTATTVATAPRPAKTPIQDAAQGKSDWRSYGPLQVDWTSWQPMGGSMVAATINAKGDTLYTSINCGARKINATNAAGQWGLWNDPASEAETKLLNDFCSRRGG
ncbi:MAG: LysM peptidoglycan-binding domain-containing protein [Cyanobium sp.]